MIKEKSANMNEARNEKVKYKDSYYKLKKIYVDLERVKNNDPKSGDVQVLVSKYMNYLQKQHGYSYNAFRELGNYYATSKEAKAYLNSYGAGFSEFLSNAIKAFTA